MENRFRRSMRFIPTYVGHTSSPGPYQFHISVHPHLRGAYAALPRQQLIFPGSSPHTWGIQGQLMYFVRRFRFIPTYVGHTWGNDRAAIPLPVHPHIRGAYEGSRGVSPAHGGSSPHTWGIHHDYRGNTGAYRFIPTYVGHTASSAGTENTITVHPHIRGAYRAIDKQQAGLDGSSPHTWGIRILAYLRRAKVRFIPTYVGHTASLSPMLVHLPVHPHIRGAYNV